MKYSDIPTGDWSEYPENKPKESGYYLTVYFEGIHSGKLSLGNLYYKCIYWSNKKQDWISWKSPFRETPHIFEVCCFVEKTRTDFYCPCIEKVQALYSNSETVTQEPPSTSCFVLRYFQLHRNTNVVSNLKRNSHRSRTR